MPWSANRYPAWVQHLPEPVRWKAIEIANALLAEGCEEGKAIRVAIAKAREWADKQSHAARPRRSGGDD